MKIWDTVYAIDFWDSRAYHGFEKIILQSNEFNQRRNNALLKLGDMLDRMFSHFQVNGTPIPLIPYVQELDKIRVAHQKLPDRRAARTVHTKLITPIRLLNKKYNKLPIILETATPLSEAALQYENMYNLYKVSKQQYQYYGMLFKLQSKLLSIALDRL